MHVYLTTSPTANVFKGNNEGLPHFVWDNITFGDWSDNRVVEFDVNLPYVSEWTSGHRKFPLIGYRSRCSITARCGPIFSYVGMERAQIRQTQSLIGTPFIMPENVRRVIGTTVRDLC